MSEIKKKEGGNMQTQIEEEHWIERKFVLIETSKAAFFFGCRKKGSKREV